MIKCSVNCCRDHTDSRKVSGRKTQAERVNNFVKICIVHKTCVDHTARQKHESALSIFVYLDFRLVVALMSLLVYDIELH